MNKNYVLYYDLIKIVATFMVCFYHLGAVDVGCVGESFYVPNFNKIVLNLCAMSVPLFFMVNGALLLRKQYSYQKIIERFIKLVLLYIFWVVVVGIIGEMFFKVENLSIIEILNGQRNTMTVHLWFLRTMAILTLLTPIFYKLYESKYKKILYVVMILLFVFPFLYNSFVLIAKWFDINNVNNLPITGVFTLYSILYFLLGKIISDESARETVINVRRKIYVWMIVITGWSVLTIEVMLWSNLNKSVYDGVNSSFPTIGALLMSVGIFYLFSKIKVEKAEKIILVVKKISENIMGVYIFHLVAIAMVTKVIHSTGTLVGAIIMTLIVMSIAMMITVVLKKIPGIRKLLSI